MTSTSNSKQSPFLNNQFLTANSLYSDFISLESLASLELSIPDKDFRHPDMLFSVKVSAKDGINYMSAQSITKQDISTIFKNSTHYNITLTNYQNKNEPSQ